MAASFKRTSACETFSHSECSPLPRLYPEKGGQRRPILAKVLPTLHSSSGNAAMLPVKSSSPVLQTVHDAVGVRHYSIGTEDGYESRRGRYVAACLAGRCGGRRPAQSRWGAVFLRRVPAPLGTSARGAPQRHSADPKPRYVSRERKSAPILVPRFRCRPGRSLRAGLACGTARPSEPLIAARPALPPRV